MYTCERSFVNPDDDKIFEHLIIDKIALCVFNLVCVYIYIYIYIYYIYVQLLAFIISSVLSSFRVRRHQ